jgi:hypothetical protein
VKITVQPDRQKAEALKHMASVMLERLEKTDKQSYPSNTLVDYYDIVHKLMEAVSLSQGVKLKGEGAHQVVKSQGLGEQTRMFLQKMRDYRNRISYEGFMVHSNYIELNEKMIGEIIKKLLGILK